MWLYIPLYRPKKQRKWFPGWYLGLRSCCHISQIFSRFPTVRSFWGPNFSISLGVYIYIYTFISMIFPWTGTSHEHLPTSAKETDLVTTCRRCSEKNDGSLDGVFPGEWSKKAMENPWKWCKNDTKSYGKRWKWMIFPGKGSERIQNALESALEILGGFPQRKGSTNDGFSTEAPQTFCLLVSRPMNSWLVVLMINWMILGSSF